MAWFFVEWNLCHSHCPHDQTLGIALQKAKSAGIEADGQPEAPRIPNCVVHNSGSPLTQAEKSVRDLVLGQRHTATSQMLCDGCYRHRFVTMLQRAKATNNIRIHRIR